VALNVPTGSVSLMFTDIEGSTKLLERLRERYAVVLEQHRNLLRAAFERHGGHEVDTQGDSFFVAFGSPADAVECAIEIQRELSAHEWPEGEIVQVRIGIHSGQPTVAATGYVGIDVHRGARIGAAAHGGQVLVSEMTQRAVEGLLPPGVELLPLGVFRFKGLAEPLGVSELRAPGLATDFPQIRTAAPEDEPPADGEPPYKGLLRFEEDDAERFFGRESVVAEVVETVRTEPFLAVVGASGSGKSSLIRAGVIPALRSEAGWRTIVMTPTENPLVALSAALADEAGPDPFRSLADADRPTIIVVDQFEELFTLCHDTAARHAFVSGLMASAGEHVHVLVTLRADFYAEVAEFPELRARMAEHQLYIGPMEPDDIRRAIEQPARLGGWDIAPGLVDLLVRDIGSEPGALPLLSHALLETWRRRRGSRMTLKGYFESGEVRGAIARTADRLYSELPPQAQQTARDILLRLTDLGEGTQDTRRRASLDELVPAGVSADADAAGDVLQRMIDARLVTVDEGAAEVAHEALIREWPLLREWLMEDREGLRTHRQIADAAAEWRSLGHERSLLFRGARLATAHEWADAHPRALNAREQAFLDASIEAEEADERERADQQRRELEAAQRAVEAERLRAEEQSAANRRLRRRAFALIGLLIVAAGLAGASVLFARQATDSAQIAEDRRLLAEQREAEANEQRAIAEARELNAAVDATISRDPELGLLIALEAIRKRNDPETDRRLRSALAASLIRRRFIGHVGPVTSVALSANQARLVSAGSDGSVRVWDATNGNAIQTLHPEGGLPLVATMDETGDRVAAGTDKGQVLIWDVASSNMLYAFTAHSQSVTGLAFDASGDRLLSAGTDGFVRTWDTATGQLLVEIEVDPSRAMSKIAAAFSPDGDRIAASGPSQHLAGVWDARTGAAVLELVGHTGDVNSLAFSPDGLQIATAGRDETARVWDATSGTLIATLRGHTSEVSAVQFLPGGLVSASSDGTALIWDLSVREPVSTLAGHSGPVLGLATSITGEIVTAGEDGTIRAWSPSAFPNQGSLSGFLAAVTTVDLNADGSLVAAGGDDWTARLFDTATGEQLHVLEGHEGGVLSVDFSPDGLSVLTSGFDGTARVWNVDTGIQTLSIQPDTGVISQSVFDPTGAQVLTGDSGGFARLWDAATGDLIATIEGDEPVTSVAFHDSGTELIIGYESGAIRVFDAMTSDLVGTLTGHSARIESLAVSPDGARLASGSADGSVRVWQIASTRTMIEIRGSFGAPHSVAFSDDGERIVSGGADGAAHVFNPSTGAELATIHVDPRDVLAARFMPGSYQVVLGTRRALVEIHDCDICGDADDVAELARSRVTRQLTPMERAQYLHESTPISSATPEASPVATPGPDATPGESPWSEPSPLPDDDVCALESGPCELPPGEYRPSRFRPAVEFRLSQTVSSFGQLSHSLAMETSTGLITLLAGARTYGYEGDLAVAIGDRGADFIDFLRTRPFERVSDTEQILVDGRLALRVETDEFGLAEPVDLFYTEPFPFAATNGGSNRVVTVDIDDSYFIVFGYPFDAASRDAFAAEFDEFVSTLRIIDT
jgi:WD40 repeat protein/class 3 adenylate cyclase